MPSSITLSTGTANTVVRNVGVYFATDEALLEEARSQDFFIETDAQLLAKLRAAQRRLQGASRGGCRTAAKRRQRKDVDVAAMDLTRKEILTLVAWRLPFAGDDEWRRIIEKRMAAAKTPLDMADQQRDLENIAKRHREEI